MGIIIGLIIGATVGFVTACIMSATGEECKHCEDCKHNWVSCGGSGFKTCERWEKK